MKKEILMKILEVTKQQQQALEREDIDEFEGLLHQRQKLMDQLDGLACEHPGYKKETEEEILKQIIEVDSGNRIEYDRQYREVQEKLKRLRSQKKVGAVYANPYERSQEEGVFFDKK